MSKQRDVVVLSGVRTAIGKYGGSLKDIPPTTLAAAVTRESVRRARVEPGEVGHAVFGNVIHTDAHDMYLARVAAVAGGAESMSRGQYWVPGLRWGQRMGDGTCVDATVGALTDPFDDCHMGVTAENVAAKWGVTREDQDALAVESHRRAAHAIAEGHFKEQILPIEVKAKKATVAFDTDEHVRPDTSIEQLAKLKPVFAKDGSVTAGTAAGINDAAAAVVLADASVAEARGL